MQVIKKQIVKVLLTNEQVDYYNYLRGLSVNCAKLIAQEGINGMVEKARQYKYYKALKDDDRPF